MSPSLERHLIHRLLMAHPLPWSIEDDWTVEVSDAKGVIVIKLMTHDEAKELIALAEAAKAQADKGDAEVEKMLADAESEEKAHRARPTQAELDKMPVNSIGTCSLCGYRGPGPRHDCKVAPR